MENEVTKPSLSILYKIGAHCLNVVGVHVP